MEKAQEENNQEAHRMDRVLRKRLTAEREAEGVVEGSGMKEDGVGGSDVQEPGAKARVSV